MNAQGLIAKKTYRLFRLESPAKASFGTLDSPALVSTKVFSADWLTNMVAVNTWESPHTHTHTHRARGFVRCWQWESVGSQRVGRARVLV